MESSTSVDLPGSREVKNFAMDSSRWEGFPYRPGDVVIASWGRSGTTWLQQIVAQLLLGPRANLNLERLSPWVEHRVTPLSPVLRMLEAQEHRRFVKTHLPANALPLSPKARYLFIGRDGRDVAISLHNFHKNHTPLAYRLMQKVSGNAGLPLLEPPGENFSHYFDEWLEGDGYPWWPFWSLIRSWWAIRDSSNVYLVHYRDLVENLDTEIRHIADFLEIDVNSDGWSAITDLCTFESMRANSSSLFGRYAHGVLAGGMKTFFRKGKVDEWRDVLTGEQATAYDARATRELTERCAAWLSGLS
jgi:aryl sulfotransferase